MAVIKTFKDVTAEYRKNYSIVCGPLIWEPRIVEEQLLPILVSMPEDWRIIHFKDDYEPDDEDYPPLIIRVLDETGQDRGRIYTIGPKMSWTKPTFGPPVMSLIFIPWSGIDDERSSLNLVSPEVGPPQQISLPWLVYDRFYPYKGDLFYAEYQRWPASGNCLLDEYRDLNFGLIGPNKNQPEYYDVHLPEGWSVVRGRGHYEVDVLDPRGRVRLVTWRRKGELKFYVKFNEFLTRNESRDNREIVGTVSANGVVLARVRVCPVTDGYIEDRDCSWAIDRSVEEWYDRSFPKDARRYNRKYVWDLSQEELLSRAGVTFTEQGDVVPVDLSIQFFKRD